MIVPFSNHYCKSLNVEIDLVVFFAKNWDTFFLTHWINLMLHDLENHFQYIYSGCTCTAPSKCGCASKHKVHTRYTCTAQTTCSCHINNLSQKIMAVSSKLDQRHVRKEESSGLTYGDFKRQLSFSCGVSAGPAGLSEGNSPSTQSGFFTF